MNLNWALKQPDKKAPDVTGAFQISMNPFSAHDLPRAVDLAAGGAVAGDLLAIDDGGALILAALALRAFQGAA